MQRFDHPFVKSLTDRWSKGDQAVLAFVKTLSIEILGRFEEWKLDRQVTRVGLEGVRDEVTKLAVTSLLFYPLEISERLEKESPENIAKGIASRIIRADFSRIEWGECENFSETVTH